MKNIKWGILGLGKIAHAFVQDLQLVEGNEIVAVASRSTQRAKAFGDEYGVSTAYGSYDELFKNAAVEIIYIATPHDSHKELSIAAMNHGKHVLCEKPLAVNKTQVLEMVEAAKRNKVFLMEAFWARFNPSISEILARVKQGDLGEVNYVNADFTFSRNDEEDSRMLNMELAGGSLLDMGVYPIFLAYAIFGKPEQILATAHFHKTGADLQTAVILKYKNGIASLMSGFRSQSDMVARICGTKATITIDPIWHETQGYKLFYPKEQNQATSVSLPTLGKGYSYEIMECMSCLKKGKLQSDKWSHQNSLEQMEILDEIRKQIGLKYPFEL